MLEAAPAAAGGTAVVEAAGSDAWAGLRARAARLFGRGDGGHERAEPARLDATAAALTGAGPGDGDGAGSGVRQSVRIGQEALGQARFAALLEGPERDRIAAELRALLREETPSRVSGNTFTGPTAVQIGDHNRQDNRFGGER